MSEAAFLQFFIRHLVLFAPTRQAFSPTRGLNNQPSTKQATHEETFAQ